MQSKDPTQGVRVVDLPRKLKELTNADLLVEKIWLFGSRAHRTGSVRSDIDLLVALKGRELNFELAPRARSIEPYLDLFQDLGSHGISLGNRSQLRCSPQKLRQSSETILLWTRRKGWIGPKWARTMKVLREVHPPYSVAFVAGERDPALPKTDVLVITGLQTEYEALLRRLKNAKKVPGRPPVPPSAQKNVRTKDGYTNVVLCRAHRMGNTAASVTAVEAIRFWSPQIVVLCGIAGGIKSEVALGDIVVPDRIVEYEATRVSVDGERMHGLVRDTSPHLRTEVLDWSGKRAWSRSWSAKRPKKPKSKVRIRFHSDAMASGHKVIALKARAKKIAKFARKIVSIEMEAIGVAEACAVFRPAASFVVIKSISDYADEKKNNGWQPFCRRAAADYVVSLIESGVLHS